MTRGIFSTLQSITFVSKPLTIFMLGGPFNLEKPMTFRQFKRVADLVLKVHADTEDSIESKFLTFGQNLLLKQQLSNIHPVYMCLALN